MQLKIDGNIKITFLSIVSHFLKNSYTKVVKLMYEIARKGGGECATNQQ
jgi:hypothetical protein